MSVIFSSCSRAAIVGAALVGTAAHAAPLGFSGAPEGADDMFEVVSRSAGQGRAGMIVAALTVCVGLVAMAWRGRRVGPAAIAFEAPAMVMSAPMREDIPGDMLPAPAFGRVPPPQLTAPCAPERWIEIAAELSCRHDRRVGVIVAHVGAYEELAFRFGSEHARQTVDIITQEIRAALRPGDLVSVRDNGEIVTCAPFVMVKDEIKGIAARLRRTIAEIGERSGIDFKVRMGTSIYPLDGYTGEELIASAIESFDLDDSRAQDLAAVAARNPYMIVPGGNSAKASAARKQRAKNNSAGSSKTRRPSRPVARAAMAGEAAS